MISYKITNANPVYDGGKANYLIDKDEAIAKWAQQKHLFSMLDYEVEWYGGLITTISLPWRAVSENSKVVTEQMLNQLKIYKSNRILTDFAFWFWETYILKKFDVMLENIDGDDVLFYVPKLDNSVDYTWGYSHETIVDLLLLREFLEGKFHAQIEWLPKSIKIPTQFIKLETLWLTVPFNYSAWVRYTLQKDWKYFKETGKTYPTSMYNNMMVSWWIHSHTAARRYGKTRGMIPQIKVDFLDVQFLQRPKKTVYIAPSTGRLNTMKRYLNQAFEKEIGVGLCTAVQSDNSMKMYKYDDAWKQTDTILSEIQLYSAQEDDVGVGDYYDYCYIDEVERMLPRNPNVLSDVLSIATNEFGYLRLVSTINKQGRYTDFIKYLQLWEQKKVDYKTFLVSLYYKYKLNEINYDALEKWGKKELAKLLAVDFMKIKREIQFYLDYTSTRVPWDLIETYTAEERAQIKKILLNEWILSYTTEWLCQLPEEVHAVDFEQQLIDSSYFEWKKRDLVIMSYDVSNWGAWDRGAVTFRGYDKLANTLEMFREVELKGDINSQYDAVVNMYRNEAILFTRWNDIKHVHLLFDQRWIWFALIVQFDRDKIPVICYQSTSSEDWRSRKERAYNVWKNYAWNLLKFNIATGSVIISSWCSTFVEEFKHFKEVRTESWYIKVQAEQWHHDDFVTSALMANWYIMDVLWWKHTLSQKHKPIEVNAMTEEDTLYEDVIEWRLVWDGKKLVKPNTNTSASSYEAFGY
jgi:hypothetical protein